MKGVWLILVVGAIGCTSTPKREMRQPTAEEFSTPPSNMYTQPLTPPRDQQLLTPKSTAPGLNTGMGGPAMGGPGMGGPGSGPMSGAPGGMRR
jgi:hypothetical protein